jgi:hypothetical protein
LRCNQHHRGATTSIEEQQQQQRSNGNDNNNRGATTTTTTTTTITEEQQQQQRSNNINRGATTGRLTTTTTTTTGPKGAVEEIKDHIYIVGDVKQADKFNKLQKQPKQGQDADGNEILTSKFDEMIFSQGLKEWSTRKNKTNNK